jgi:hemolysin activation/secretion protein
VEGNTLLAPEVVERIVTPYTGKQRDFGDVQRALEALQDAYLELGYDAVRVLVPEQDLVSGQVRLEVLEARIRKILVEGNRFFDTANVRASLPALREGEAPNTRDVGENLQLVNENPAKKVNVRLAAVEDEPGRVDAVARVSDQDPARATVFLDNTGSASTGYYRAGFGYQHANLFDRDHVITAQIVTSPTQINDVKVLGVGYRVPLYEWKSALDVFAGYSDVDSGTVQNLFSVSGSGTILGARFSRILPRLPGYEHKLALGWDYRAFKQNVSLLGTTGTLVPDITIKPLSLTYSGRLSRAGSDLSLFVSYSHNLPGGNDADQAAFTMQRAGASANYTIVRFGASYSQALDQDFLLRAAFNVQRTKDRLVPGEQFGMGGADSVRGFFEREVANDRGYRFSIEGYSPDFGKELGAEWRARALLFADFAHGSDLSPVRGADNGLGSVGVGLRFTRGSAVSLLLDLAQVTNPGGSRDRNKQRLHFAVAYRF